MLRFQPNDRKRAQTRLRVQRRRRVLAILQSQEHNIQNRIQNAHNTTNIQPNNNDIAQPHPSARTKFRIWAIKHNISQNALSDLLKILIGIGLTWLPSDARTLLKTPKPFSWRTWRRESYGIVEFRTTYAEYFTCWTKICDWN